MTFYENYLQLCEKAGKTPSGAALEMGLSKPTVNRWKNGGGLTDATALKVASYFGVTVAELKGEESEQKEKPYTLEGDGLDSRLSAYYDDMTPEERAKLIEYAEFIVSKRKDGSNG